MEIFILLAMIFCHVVDDYYLQGILANLKQKSWWRRQKSYDEMYAWDYIMGLLMHSLSWAFMIMLPIAFYFSFQIGFDFGAAFIINTIIHAVIDDLKANKKKINLVVDQTIHIAQVVLTYVILMVI